MSKQKLQNPFQNPLQKRNNHLIHDLNNQPSSSFKKSQPIHSFTQPKPRSNIIKVNKAKLPADFFPKCWSFERKLPHFRLNLKDQDKELYKVPKQRRVESQRLHISPEKTSFFGFFDNENDNKQIRDGAGSNKVMSLKRKFTTRQQPKRDNSQQKRRFTPGSHSGRNDLLQVFPPPYEQHMTQIIISSNNSSVRGGKLSPRKQHISKYRQIQQIHDPQKGEQFVRKATLLNNDDELNITLSNKSNIQAITTPVKRGLINLKTIQKSPTNSNNTPNSDKKFEYTFAPTSSQTVDLHNMTFFNSKSSSLPPIKKN